jgi:hypothetical protein
LSPESATDALKGWAAQQQEWLVMQRPEPEQCSPIRGNVFLAFSQWGD